MKKLHSTTIKNPDYLRGRVRLGMTLAGILTAIICSVALLNETPLAPPEVEVSVSQLVETPKVVVADLSVEVIGGAMVSAMWPF